MVTVLLVGVVWTAGSSWNGNWWARGAKEPFRRPGPERPARASGWRGAEGWAPGGRWWFRGLLVRFVPSRTQEVAPQGRVVGVSVSGEVDEKLGDARRGRCLAEPGAVAPLAVVFRVHPAFSKSFVAF